MMIAERGSEYRIPPDAAGDERVYGVFPGQRILGYPCTITASELPDHSFGAVDLLGNAGSFARNGGAIHISGLDPFGKRTGPGFIRALARYSVAYESEDHPSGLGSDGIDPACIVTWDGDAAGRYHRTDDWQHHAMFGSARAYVTLAGVLEWCKQHNHLSEFNSASICEWLDARKLGHVRYSDRQHVSAIGRLLASFIGVSNNYLATPAILRRKGRSAYHWEIG